MQMILVYIGMILYAIGAIIYSKQTGMVVTNNWWLQTIAIGAGGLFLLIKNTWSSIPTFKLPSFSSAKSAEPNLIYVPKDFEEKDLESLLHIKNRLLLAKSEEGIKVWKDLAAIMLDLDTKVS